MTVVYEDKDIVVCIKPDGMLSQSDEKGSKSAVSYLKEKLQCDIFPVHRLDRTTFGLMVFAKNSASAAALTQQIAEHKFTKRYVTVVHGAPEASSARLEDLMFFDRTKNKAFVSKKMRAGVKKAVLDFRVTQSGMIDGEAVSRLEVSLLTGRTHQIRLQFASRGMPLLGDNRYGAKDRFKRIALCAYCLGFCHPATHQKLEFTLDEATLETWLEYFK